MARNKDFFVNSTPKRDRSFFVKEVAKPNINAADVRKVNIADFNLMAGDTGKKVRLDSEINKLETQIQQKEADYVRANNISDWNKKNQTKSELQQELNALRQNLDTSKQARESLDKGISKGTIMTPEQLSEHYDSMSIPQKIDKAIKWDIPQTAEKVGRTGMDLIGNVATGVTKGMEGYVDAAVGAGGIALSGIANLAGKKEAAQNIKNRAEEIAGYGFSRGMEDLVDEKSQQGAEIYKPSILGIDVRDAAQEIARMYSVGATGGLPGFMVSASGGNIEEALNEGESLGRATTYGAISGSLEGIVEKMFDPAKILGGGLKTIGKGFLGKIAEATVGEGAEEGITAALNPFIKMLTYKGETENPFGSWENFKNYLKDIGQSVYQGAVIGGLTLGVSAPGNVDLQKSFSNDVYNAVEKMQGIDQVQKNEIANTILEGAKSVTGQDIKNIREYVDVYKRNSQNTQRMLQNLTKNTDLSIQRENVTGLPKLNVQNDLQTANNQQTNVTLPTQAEMAQKANTEQINTNPNLATQKAQKTYQSAKIAGMTDVDMKKAIDLNNMLRSGANLEFYDPQNIPQGVDTLRAADANGFYMNGTLWINKNSEMKVEKILGHELTHYVENDDLVNTILDSNIFYDFLAEKGFNNTAEFKTYLMEKKGYKQEELNSEMVAHFAEEKLFGKEETINKLARENRTLAQKILNWISDLRTKIAGNTEAKELLKIENMYRKALEQARNNSIPNTTDVKYNIKRLAEFDENEYNNIQEMQLTSKEYGKLAHIVDTDPTIKPGLNQVETSDATYVIYQKEYNDFKVVDKYEGGVENDTIANGNVRGTSKTGDGREKFQTTVESIPNQRATKSNDELLNGNSRARSVSIESNNDGINNKKDVAGKEPAFSLPEIPKGYTRLYRGLTEEYNKNYDKRKLDNSNGYESWTDNYDLAKAYGDNVYYIDIPTSDIKNDIIDNDSKSETYGDRNLIYFNDKPVGIKGKSGNEYMLYTDHDNYSDIEYKKVKETDKVSFSMPETDNQGRTLSKEQQEFFKDSKVRDENGKLLEVYHGTNEEFTIFDKDYLGSGSGDLGFLGDGFYFATHKGEAGYYGGKVMPVYLNIKNPYDISQLLKYNGKELRGEGSSTYLKIANLVSLNKEWADIEIGSTTYGDIQREVQGFLDNVEMKYLGKLEGYDGELSDYWEVKYKDYNKKEKTIEGYSEDSLKADCLNEYMRRKAGYINSHDVVQYITEYSKYEGGKSLSQVLQEKGYDGIFQSEDIGDEIVVFEPNQIKNVDNTSPTENPDIRYSVNPVNIAKNPPNIETGLDQLNRAKRVKEGDSQSNFASNILNQSIFDEKFTNLALDDKNIRSYESISNKETLQEANDAINEQGQKWVDRFLDKPNGEMKATDIAGGFILMNRYQQVGDYESMIRVAEKLRKAGTQQGQTIQMFSVLGRMTPEGMTYYAQKELSKAYDEILKNKTQKWADEHADEFKLNEKDIEYIQRRVTQAAKLPEGRDKYVLLGEIASRIQNKIPPQAGQGLKALARNSMLLNPKTMVRNILGNVVIVPNHIVSDFVGARIDKAISKKTGVRTTGGFDVKALQGAKKGIYESFDDFRRKISTREMGGDRFEIGQGKNFYENHTGRFGETRNKINKALNGLDRVTGFLLETGDRPFYETWFINSLNNQMKLNNVTQPTAEMIEIATDEALQRTWQDNNSYTRVVKSVRDGFNKINIKGYGLGDMVMPFVKTPANLTKAVVDFSPLGAINAAVKTSQFNKDIGKGTATAKQQREVVKAWSQVITGSLGMAILTALANAGVLSGGSDEDKDVRSFEQNILGIKPYSIKIGDKTYTYDWAQPLGTSAAMVADTVKSLKNAKDTEGKVAAILEGAQSGASVLLEQSFVSGIRNLFEEDNLINALIETGFNEASKFTPQFLSQLAQIQDDTARTSYVYNNIPQTALNKVKAKIPGLRETLEPSVDVLGREVKTDNSVGNVMFNPANTAFARTTEGAEEMYRVYQATGDKATIAQVAPYYFNVGTEKVVLTPKQRTQYQKTIGKIASDGVESLLKNKAYEQLEDTDKAEILKDLYSYGTAIAKAEASTTYLLPNDMKKIKDSGMKPEEYILLKYISNLGGTKKDEKYNSLVSAGYTQKETEEFLTDYKGYKFDNTSKNTLPTLKQQRAKLPTLKK